MSFTENSFPVEVSQGSSGGASFNTDIVTTKAGYEARNANWSQARHRYNVSVGVRGVDDFETLKTFFMAMNGNLQGFRFKDWGDFKSCGITETVTETDQTIGNGDGATNTFQLVKSYTDGFTYQRTITKPVIGTVLISVGDMLYSTNYSVDSTTGVITFEAITKSISGAVSSGSQTIISSGSHTLQTGDRVYLSGFTGDWVGLNGSRYTITLINGNSFSIEFDSSAYTAYSSNGGQLDSLPQSGESVKAGFEFDVPCRFDSDSMQSRYDNFQIFDTDLSVIELRV